MDGCYVDVVMIFVLLVFIVSPISLLTVSRSLSIISRSLAELDISIISSANLRWVVNYTPSNLFLLKNGSE